MFEIFFFIVGILWYVGVIDSFSGIQKWTEDVVKTGYDKTQQLSDEIGKMVDKKKDGSSSQMNIIIGIAVPLLGLYLGCMEEHRRIEA